MLTPKRVYIYAVSAISLQSVAWAIISLLRNIFITGGDPNLTAIAFQLAVILIGLPVFLVHWLWAQRLAANDLEERGSVVRRLYLYGNEAAFLIPVTTSVFYLFETFLSIPTGRERFTSFAVLSAGQAILYYLIAIVILVVLMYYHYRILQEDTKVAPEVGKSATARRFFVYLFAAVGLGMTATALSSLVRWLLFQIGGSSTIDMGGSFALTHEISRLFVGILLWVFFWRWAQRLFLSGGNDEQESVLRKFYLYAVIFVAVFTAVTSTAFILSGLFKELMDVSSGSVSSGDIRIPLSIMVVAGVVWAYHAAVLREDEGVYESTDRQAGIRRLYDYLVAGIGLVAFIVGLSGDLSVLIRSTETGAFGGGEKELLAWFTAVWLIGVVVWILPWRSAQARATEEGTSGMEERQSTVRKIYLYLFLFIATMTILSSVVYLLFSILAMLMGESGPTMTEVAQPIAFSLIAAGVWLYHGFWLREDGRRLAGEKEDKLESFKVIFIDEGPASRLEHIASRIREHIPGIAISVGVLGTTEENESVDTLRQTLISEIHQANLIVGPWQLAVDGGLNKAVTPEVSDAVVGSLARKLITPNWYDGWDWVGVEHWSDDALVDQTARAIKQIVQGDDVRLVKPLGAGAIIGIIIGILFLLTILSISIPILLFQGLY